MTARIIVHDERYYDELLALRTELFWQPNPDGSPSTAGRVVFHTMWYHFRDGMKFAETLGPRLEHSFDTLLGRSFDVPVGEGQVFTLSTALLMGGIKQAFDELANEILNPPAPEPEAPPPEDPPTPEEPPSGG